MGCSVRSSQQGATQGIRIRVRHRCPWPLPMFQNIFTLVILARRHAGLRCRERAPHHGSCKGSEHSCSDIGLCHRFAKCKDNVPQDYHRSMRNTPCCVMHPSSCLRHTFVTGLPLRITIQPVTLILSATNVLDSDDGIKLSEVISALARHCPRYQIAPLQSHVAR